ncbi:MAG: hypothetical protein RR653_12315 [Clostridia bacterium]
MKKNSLMVISQFGNESQDIGQILMHSFLIFLQREIKKDADMLAPKMVCHV